MRNRQFTQLISDLRAELRRNNDPGVRASDLPAIQQAINRSYETLYDEYDWPFLTETFDAIPLSAGQRYYDFPTTMDLDRLETVVVWFNNQPTPIERGISFADYASYNSEAVTPVRTDPVLKWDVRRVGTATQIEVWPIPASNDQTLQFKGRLKFARMVDDADLCLLDDMIVVLGGAIAIETNDKNRQEKMLAQQMRLANIKKRSKTDSKMYRLGLGAADAVPSGRVTVRIAGA